MTATNANGDVHAAQAHSGSAAQDDAGGRVMTYVVVLTLSAAGLIVLAAGNLAYASPGVLVSHGYVGGVILFVAALLVLHRYSLHLEWRGHRLTTTLDDIALFLALIALPPATIVFAFPFVSLLMHYWTGRESIKGAFNIAQETIAPAVAWGTFVGFTALDAPLLLAAAGAATAHTVGCNLLLAGVFARLEGVGTLSVFWDRFAAPSGFIAAFAAGGGIVLYALWVLHPLAVLGFLPFAYVAHRYGALLTRTDRELTVHRHLASVSFDLVGTSSLDAVADRVLDTCGNLLLTGRAVLRLHDADGRGPREWSRDFTGGPNPNLTHEVALPGRDGGSLGQIIVHARPAMSGFSEAEREIMRTVAGTTAAAVENARALQHLEDARETALETNEALAKQEKLSTLGTLVAGVAHEIGNPLTYMKGNLELALTTVDDLAAMEGDAATHGESLREDLSQAIEGVERLQEITVSLKDMARGRKERQFASLNDIVREVEGVVRTGFPRNVALHVDVADAETSVRVNRGQITQVTLNLVKNAAEAIGDAPGNVTVATRVDDKKAFLTVRDDGPGIPEDVQEQLFTQFFTTKENGTGLGLHLSRRIAKGHGGTLACDSVVGEGTTFTLTLPLSSPDDEDVTQLEASDFGAASGAPGESPSDS